MYRQLALLPMLLPASLVAVEKNATIGLHVEVLPACLAGSSNGGGIEFGTLDFGTHIRLDNVISKIGQSNAGALQVNCQQGVPYNVLISGGYSGSTANRKMASTSAAELTYNLFTSSDYTTVWDDTIGVSGVGNGQSQWLPVYGRVPAQPVPLPGSYSDTLTVTVSW